MLLQRLPRELEDGASLLKRREKAAERKEKWRSVYQECYEYTMPQRETFSWYAEGQRKNREIYDSTGKNATYLSANNMQALLCPPWKHWAMLAPGGDVTPDVAESQEVIDQLQEITSTVFHYINHSNFSTVATEVFLDLMVGTGAMCIDEGDPNDPIVFDAIPLSALEIEEGPRGTVETVWMKRKPLARNLVRTFPGMQKSDLPPALAKKVTDAPDTEIEIVQGAIYNPRNKRYYGVAIHCESKAILWRYDYADSSPYVVARASVIAGELYGRGPVMNALPDIKTLNRMQEFVLRHSNLVVAPPMTGVSDGVLNPYTAQLIPNSIIPVASNDNGNPSLRPLEVGGNFMITDAIMDQLRQSVRKMLLGDTMSEQGPIKSATEIAISDRNRLWNMGAVYGRIQSELLSKIISRVVWILQKQGKLPPLKVDGKMVTLKYVSPLARAQDQEDLLSLGHTLELAQAAAASGGEAGMMAIATGFKFDAIPAWLAKRTGLDADLVRSETERKQMVEQAMAAAQEAAAAQPQGGNVVPMRRPA